MGKYEKDRKFYWLQLKEDFFEEGAIDWLEEQENGIAYSHFYLKLCLKSLRNDGVLIRKVGSVLMPYDAKKLSEITKTDLDTVIVAMELLKKIGLVKILESGEIYLTQVENMIGSKSMGAFKKQQQRQLKKENNSKNLLQSTSSGQMSEKCPREIEIEIEIDKDIEIDIETRDKEKENDTTPVLSFPTPIHELLFNNFSEVAYKTWFADTTIDVKGQLIVISANGDFKKEAIQKYSSKIQLLTGKQISVKDIN